MGLMTPDDVEALMREEAATGRAFADLAVERGHITAENMAKLAEPAPAPVHIETQPAPPERRTPIFGDSILAPPTSTPIAVAPEPVVVAPEPVVAAPAPDPVVLAEQTQDHAHVFICLSSGERIAAGAFASEAEAEQRAYELMSAVDVPGSWPKIDGRFIRPDAILSIDVELTSA
jgi:hypothetical protein